MMKLNELAERHGIDPCEFVATLDSDSNGRSLLCFDTFPEEEGSLSRFSAMLGTLGIRDDDTPFAGSDREIYDRIISAIRRSPAPRLRR